MDVLEDIGKARATPSVVALGFFDGIHLGHRKVLNKCVELAKGSGKLARVFTFSSEGLLPRHKSGIIQDEQEKREIFFALGIDEIISPDFSTFSQMTADKFVKNILVEQFGATDIVCGRNYHFGKGGNGDIEYLRQSFEQYGGNVHIVGDEMLDGVRLSSTTVRKALAEGDVAFAEKALTRPFSVSGVVMHGKKLGRQISFPTINIIYPEYRTPILRGVYLTEVQLSDSIRWGITNVGVRPTVNSGKDILIECHILDYNGDLYNKEVRIYFKNLLRKEKKFDTIDELKKQILVDERAARGLLSNMGVYLV